MSLQFVKGVCRDVGSDHCKIYKGRDNVETKIEMIVEMKIEVIVEMKIVVIVEIKVKIKKIHLKVEIREKWM